jgi:hypothetical protein
MSVRPHRVICISVYCDELAELDKKVASLRASGCTTASRSGLIRAAVEGVDLKKAAARIQGPMR